MRIALLAVLVLVLAAGCDASGRGLVERLRGAAPAAALLQVRDRDGNDVFLHSAWLGGDNRFRLAPGFEDLWEDQRAFTHAGP